MSIRRIGMLTLIFTMISYSIVSAEINDNVCKKEDEVLLEQLIEKHSEYLELYDTDDVEKLKDTQKKIKEDTKKLKKIEFIDSDKDIPKKKCKYLYKELNDAFKYKIKYINKNKDKYKEKSQKSYRYVKSTYEYIDKYIIKKELHIENGTLEQVYKDEDESLLIVKTKISPSYSNRATINQNFYNIDNIIKEQVGTKYKEIQYWAVAEMESGDIKKVISFTVDEELIKLINSGSSNALPNNLKNKVKDLWLTPSLRE